MFKVIFTVFMVVFSTVVQASQQSDALSTCLADNTNGKERKALARWIFISISAHPEIQDVANVPDQKRTKSNKDMANLVMKLLTESCVAQTKAAVKADGQEALQSSFKTLGGLAMQEIMTNQNVTSAISDYAKLLDGKKLNSVLSGN